MIRLEEAIRISLEQAERKTAEKIPLQVSAGRILAEDIIADRDMPPFDKSAMDGFACRREDITQPLRILETIAAGQLPKQSIAPGTCSRIMTGAPVPEGADCVIVVEKTEIQEDGRVHYLEKDTPLNICYRGEDLREGDVILRRGTRIRAQEVAVLASAGYDRVSVYRKPAVGIASTGDELYPPGADLPAGAIRDSNSYQLAAQVETLGIEAINHGIVSDTPEQIQAAIAELEVKSDVILLTGGVSAGDFDLVPGELEKAGYRPIFYKVAIKPGMPLWFGRKKGTWCFGLPGNPVSTFVQFEYLIRPFLNALMGCKYEPRVIPLPMGTGMSIKRSERDSILPVRIEGGHIMPLEYHGSAHISAIPFANGFITVKGSKGELKKEDIVDVRFI